MGQRPPKDCLRERTHSPYHWLFIRSPRFSEVTYRLLSCRYANNFCLMEQITPSHHLARSNGSCTEPFVLFRDNFRRTRRTIWFASLLEFWSCQGIKGGRSSSECFYNTQMVSLSSLPRLRAKLIQIGNWIPTYFEFRQMENCKYLRFL